MAECLSTQVSSSGAGGDDDDMDSGFTSIPPDVTINVHGGVTATDYVIVYEEGNIDVAHKAAEYLNQHGLMGQVIPSVDIGQYTSILSNTPHLLWTLMSEEEPPQKRRRHESTPGLAKLLYVLASRWTRPHSLIILSTDRYHDMRWMSDSQIQLALNCYVNNARSEWKDKIVQAMGTGSYTVCNQITVQKCLVEVYHTACY